ncbi:MAG TPA: helix-turn-helix domain-containing protein, partial [Solimonas sp.]
MKKKAGGSGNDRVGFGDVVASGRARPSAATTTRRGRPSSQQSKAITRTILDAAAELFLRDGFEATGMESVAASAGIPKTTLYKRYADKRELLNAVLVDRVSSWSKVSSRTDRNISDDLSARLKSRTATMLVWATKSEVRAVTRLAASLPGKSDGRV